MDSSMSLPEMDMNDKQQVSSIWVAKICDKSHNNVLRDIRFKAEELNINLSRFSSVVSETKKNNGLGGRPADVIWLTLPQTISLMGAYRGERAMAARRICLAALDAFFSKDLPGYKPQHADLYKDTKSHIETIDKNDPDFAQLFTMRESIERQIQHQAKIKGLETGHALLIEENNCDTLTHDQISKLDSEISKKVKQYNLGKVAGLIKRDIKKKYFKIRSSRTYKEIPRRVFDEALDLVKNWKAPKHSLI